MWLVGSGVQQALVAQDRGQEPGIVGGAVAERRQQGLRDESVPRRAEMRQHLTDAPERHPFFAIVTAALVGDDGQAHCAIRADADGVSDTPLGVSAELGDNMAAKRDDWIVRAVNCGARRRRRVIACGHENISRLSES